VVAALPRLVQAAVSAWPASAWRAGAGGIEPHRAGDHLPDQILVLDQRAGVGKTLLRDAVEQLHQFR
jgi:hypothetical protein